MSDFMVLASLRRLGVPYQASPSELYNVLERSLGGMTKMINRLEAIGFVKRVADPNDGRSSLVCLTAKGITVHGKAFQSFVESSRELLSELSAKRLKDLDRSLQDLVSAFEEILER
jgi:DNA-binding MarR family transcriptional regulator